MTFRSGICIIILMVLAVSAEGQDRIFKRNGEIVEAKIKSTAADDIKYYRWDNPNGPEYTMLKSDVNRIVYQNGSVDKFDGDGAYSYTDRGRYGEQKVAKYRNILSFAPFQFTENGLGFGVSYEKILDKTGYIAFCVPLVATFNLNNGTYTDYNGTQHNGHTDAMIYAMPGIKIYPTSAWGVLKYAIGPSIVLASGQKSYAQYASYPNYGITSYDIRDHQLLGMLINNYINVNLNPHVYLGVEFGFGFTYLNRVGGLNSDTNGLVQGCIKMGYRY